MKKLYFKEIRSKENPSSKQLMIFTLVFVSIGTYLVFHSLAAGFAASIEPENGTITPPASLVNDATASGGSALKFRVAGSCALPNFPDETCTGVPAGVVLTSGPGITVTTAGQVVNGVNVPWIEVKAPNVTIRNSRIHGDEPCLIRNFSNGTGLLIEDSEIDGEQNPATGVCSDNYTLRRVDVQGLENGLDVGTTGNVTVEDSYIHALRNTTTSHTDGIQMDQGSSNIVIRHNYIRVQDSGTPNSNAAIIMWTKANPQNSNVRIENNRLDGTRGTYTLFAPQQTANNIYINNNRILPGIYGHTTSVDVGVTVTEFNGNVDDATGTPLSAQ